jgi:hypothetical protein
MQKDLIHKMVIIRMVQSLHNRIEMDNLTHLQVENHQEIHLGKNLMLLQIIKILEMGKTL